MKLLIAMTMAIVSVTGTALLIARKAAEIADQARLQREFQGEMGWELGSREARLAAMSERCRSMAKSVRILAALEEGEIDDLYKNAEVELRGLRRTTDGNTDDAGNPDDTGKPESLLSIEDYCFLDAAGEVLRPSGGTNKDDKWWRSQVALENLPPTQQSGYVAKETGSFDALREIVITPILSHQTKEPIGSLVLFFLPVESRSKDRAGMNRGVLLGNQVYATTGSKQRIEAMKSASDAPPEGELVYADKTQWMAFSWQVHSGSSLPPARMVCLYPVSGDESHQQSQQLRIAGTGVLVLVLGMLLSLLLSSRLAKPVQRLVQDSQQNLALRKEAECARELTEQKYKSIFENAVEGLFVMDANGMFLSVNPAAASICGFASTEAFLKEAERPGFQLYMREADLMALLTSARDGGPVANREMEMIRRGGARIWVSHSIRRVDDGGGAYHFEGSLEDITERRRAAGELQSLNSGLEKALSDLRSTQQQVIQQERLRALGEMASGVAHDFNNALTPILGYSELLLNKGAELTDAEKAEYLRTISTAATDAASVVSRLREFYRTQGCESAFHPVDLNSLVRQVVTLTKPRWKDQARSRGVTITVETDLARTPPAIMGEAPALREMLTNMIFNAVDAMPNGGVITLRTRRSLERSVIEVQDTGTGMPEEVRRHCLEPFFSTKGDRGTGLGLSMCFGIVQRHGGDLDIRSTEGKGTTFVMTFPQAELSATAEASAPAPPQESPAPAPTRPSLNILAVDDEPPIRLLLQAMLKNEGHRVSVASDGQEAMNLFKAGGFDLVITDKSMPGMSGDQLAAVVKAVSPATPVILLTGFGQFMDTGGVPGVDFIASKPISVETLRAAIASTMAT